MVRTRSSTKRKEMEVVPETSMSSGDMGNIIRPRDFRALKGKAVAIGSPSKSDDDFQSYIPANQTKEPINEALPVRKLKIEGEKDKIAAMKFNRKRDRNDISSDQGDSDGKGKKVHIPNSNTSKLKGWDMLMSGVPYFSSKIDSYNAESTISEIKNGLTQKQQELFKYTCFGDFLDLQNFEVQSQLIHNILFREVVQSNNDELWIDFNEKVMRFGIQEFALITGLKCVGLCNKLSVKRVRGGLYDKYFARFGSITRQVIHQRFLTGNFDDDDDAVKIASLHLLVNFLMGGPLTKLIDPAYIDLLDADASNVYPWGKEIYQFAIKNLKGNCYGKEQIAIDNFNKGKGRFIYYRLRGFVIPLQFWFYEICKEANGVACIPQGDKAIPRMVKWRCIGKQKTKDIQPKLLSLPHNKFNNISPTEQELEVLMLEDLFKQPNQFLRDHAKPSSSMGSKPSDFACLLGKLYSKQNEITNEMAGIIATLNEFSTDVMTRLQSIQNAIDKGVCSANISTRQTGMVDSRKGQDNGVPKVMENNHNVARATSPDALPLDQYVEISTQMLDELVKSASKPAPSNVPKNKDVLHIDHTRGAKPVLQCPEPHDNIQSSMPSFAAIVDGLDDIVPNPSIDVTAEQVLPTAANLTMTQKKRIGSCPLDELYWTIEDQVNAAEFDEWLEFGALVHPRKTPSGVVYYKVRCGDIKPPFDFNVAQVRCKTWFRTLDAPGSFFEDAHVDVIFYYLRKLAFYSKEDVDTRYTTTDVLFHQTISSLYASYSSKSAHSTVINTSSPIVDYIIGHNMRCGSPWVDVDDVMFPMHIPNCAVKWVLATLSLVDGHIFVFNSRKDPHVLKSVDEAVKPYATLIPLFLDMVGFYNKRKDIDVHRSYYKAKKLTDPFVVTIADKLPVPLAGDCGLHMVTYAEQFICDTYNLKFDAVVNRKRLAYLLWAHAMTKRNDGSVSDEESPGELPATIRPNVCAAGGI